MKVPVIVTFAILVAGVGLAHADGSNSPARKTSTAANKGLTRFMLAENAPPSNPLNGSAAHGSSTTGSGTTGSQTTGSSTTVAPVLPSGPFSLAFVDLVRVSQEYDGTKKGQDELDSFQQSLKKQIDDLEAIRFLDDQERTEINTLRGIANPAPEQVKRMNDLLNLSKTRGDRLRALQQQPNKTDAEKAEFDRLTQQSAKTDEDTDTLGSKLEDQLQAKGADLSRKLTDIVSTAIQAVAKEKGYSAVVDKKAVLFGGIDITDEVLKRLNTPPTK